METLSSWTSVLFSLGCVALIAGLLLGYAVGYRMGGRRERFRQTKERLKRNKALVCQRQKEQYAYARQVQQLEEEVRHWAVESEQ